MMTSRGVSLWVYSLIGGILMVLAACQGGTVAPSAPVVGDQSFSSAPPDYGGWRGGYAEDGATNSAAPTGEQGATTPAEREIEEADIVKVEGNTLYALNTYRGLYIIDITNPDAPAIQGHLDVYGYPIEMYVRDNRAYLVLSNYFRIWRHGASPNAEIGSAVVAVDITLPESPVELSRYYLPGYVTDTRIVGDVLYGVSNRYSWFGYYYPTDDWEDTTHVVSINIADSTVSRKFSRWYGDFRNGPRRILIPLEVFAWPAANNQVCESVTVDITGVLEIPRHRRINNMRDERNILCFYRGNPQKQQQCQ